LDMGDLGAEVVMEGELRARVDLDPAEDQRPVGGAADAAGLSQGVTDRGGFGLGLSEGAGQDRAEDESDDERERYEEIGPADGGTVGSGRDGACSRPNSAASNS